MRPTTQARYVCGRLPGVFQARPSAAYTNQCARKKYRAACPRITTGWPHVASLAEILENR